MSESNTGERLAAAVWRAIEDAHRDFEKMPFLVRPLVRLGFSRRTGMGADAWRSLLGSLRGGEAAGAVRQRVPQLESSLGRLLADFEGAPERARRGMGDQPERLREVEARSLERAAVVREFLGWLRS